MMKALVLAVLTLAAASVQAHAKLQTSTPADGATVAAPAELRLQYNEPVEAAMSAVTLTGPGGAAVAAGKPAADKADEKALVLSLPALAPGSYRVDWATVGHDGHRTKGEIRFTVK
jgi:methionine-rich copper-binding protein CopC